jgi:hypothetical protein
MRRFGLGLLVLSVLALNAYATPILGTAGTFAVLGATPNVTNTGATTLNGSVAPTNIGVSPANSITGLNTITINGVNAATLPGAPFVHLNDPVAQQAQSDLTTAILALQGLAGSATVLSAADYNIGTHTFNAGVSILLGRSLTCLTMLQSPSTPKAPTMRSFSWEEARSTPTPARLLNL